MAGLTAESDSESMILPPPAAQTDFRRPGVVYGEPRPCNLGRARIEELAELIRGQLSLPVGANIHEVVRGRLHGRIHYRGLDEWDWSAATGSVYIHGTMDFDLVLPNHTSPARDRFTIAHELGHYFLHSAQGRTPIVARRNGSGTAETEANYFAAALLMPEGEVKKVWAATPAIEAVAATCAVSFDAAEVRLAVLKLQRND